MFESGNGKGPKGSSSYTIRRQALIEAVTTAMSKRLELLQVAKETTNKTTKLEGHFPQGIYLGRQELECYNNSVQDAHGEARIDKRHPGSCLWHHSPGAYSLVRKDQHRLRSVLFVIECISKECLLPRP